MSQIAYIGNISAEELGEILVLAPLREINEKRFGFSSQNRFENPTLAHLVTRLGTCTVCSGSVFVHLAEIIESLLVPGLDLESKALSRDTGAWVSVYTPNQIPQIISDLNEFSAEEFNEEERALIANGIAWFIAHAEQCTEDQVCVLCVS